MTNPLELSARYVDEGVYEGPLSVNRMSTKLAEVGDGVAFVEAFSNVVVFDSSAGLVVFDTSLEMFAPGVLASLRVWSDEPVESLCYTHGHVDHVGGAGAFLADAEQRGHSVPTVVGHRGVMPRFERYELTNGYNGVINRRQFAMLGGGVLGAGNSDKWGPSRWVAPDEIFD